MNTQRNNKAKTTAAPAGRRQIWDRRRNDALCPCSQARRDNKPCPRSFLNCLRSAYTQEAMPPRSSELRHHDRSHMGEGNRVSVRRAQRSHLDGTVKARLVPWEDDEATATAAPPNRSGPKMGSSPGRTARDTTACGAEARGLPKGAPLPLLLCIELAAASAATAIGITTTGLSKLPRRLYKYIDIAAASPFLRRSPSRSV